MDVGTILTALLIGSFVVNCASYVDIKKYHEVWQHSRVIFAGAAVGLIAHQFIGGISILVPVLCYWPFLKIARRGWKDETKHPRH